MSTNCKVSWQNFVKRQLLFYWVYSCGNILVNKLKQKYNFNFRLLHPSINQSIFIFLFAEIDAVWYVFLSNCLKLVQAFLVSQEQSGLMSSITIKSVGLHTVNHTGKIQFGGRLKLRSLSVAQSGISAINLRRRTQWNHLSPDACLCRFPTRFLSES